MTRRALLAVLAAAAVPPAAAAHGGATVASGANAAYTLSVQAADARTADGRPAVDLTAYPVRRSNGAPDLAARVVFDAGGRRVAGVRRGDGVHAVLEVPERGAWRAWALAATVTGAAGRLTVRGEATEVPDDGPPGWAVPVSLAGLVGLGVLVVLHRRRPSGQGAATRDPV